MKEQLLRKAVLYGVCAFLVVAVSALPIHAASLLIVSTLSDTTGAMTYVDDPGLLTYNASEIAALSFSPTTAGTSGVPYAYDPNQPAGIQQVAINATDDSYGDGASGFIETTFTLPAGYSNASISGTYSIDDAGCVFLNGINLGCMTDNDFNSMTYETDTLFGSDPTSYYATFSTAVASDFVAGTNTLIISDNNYSGPSGMEFDATVNYSTSAVPEPGTLLFLGSGLAGLAAQVRRKYAARVR